LQLGKYSNFKQGGRKLCYLYSVALLSRLCLPTTTTRLNLSKLCIHLASFSGQRVSARVHGRCACRPFSEWRLLYSTWIAIYIHRTQ